jgi:endonuclease-3
MSLKHLDEIVTILEKEMKHIQTPLVSRRRWEIIPHTPFTTLISCLLSLRTKDEITEEASIRLLKKHHTPEQLLKLSEEQIQELIYPVGFYKVKSRRIKEISQTILDSYDGKVPTDFETLMSLKGVGKKTAAIVMVYGHNIPDYIPVDIHVHVIANRLGWVDTTHPDDTMEELMKTIPKKYWGSLNHLLVKFGQTYCLTISPYCSKCPIQSLCPQKKVTTHR